MTDPTKDTITSEGTPKVRPSTVDEVPDFSALTDEELKAVVRRLNRAARAAADLPASAEGERVVTAAASARVALRRRRLREAVADGVAALAEVAR